MNKDFEMGQVLAKLAQLQKAIKVAQDAANQSKVRKDWHSFAYHTFYYGRLWQGIHFLKEKYNLDINIPEPSFSDVPNFISQQTRDNFPEVC